MSFIQVLPKENYATLQLDRGKSNPINHQFIKDLRQALEQVLQDDKLEGAIIHGKPNFFSVGLDLPELYSYDKQQFKDFWRDFMWLIRDMIAFNKPLVASITGHAPAGGCILAIGCDYRVISEGNHKIGLNEIPIGIVVPRGVFDIYSFWIGRRNAYQYLMEGKLYFPEHAKEIGLVDEVVPQEDVFETAEKQLKKYLSFDQNGWRFTKQQLKRDLLHSISSISEEDMKIFSDQWWSPQLRGNVEKFIENLKKK